MKEKNIVVFLGPTLTVDKAKEFLPHAIFLPPAKCQSFLHALSLNPSHIILIDGYFENTPSVWHKEILYAMEKGIQVIGASSMGALRAAELHHYGMQGVGEIFHWYKSGLIEDDDEVAVVHQLKERGYLAMSDALVNIRATLLDWQQQGYISSDTMNILIKNAKDIHYKERNLASIIEHSPLNMRLKASLLDRLPNEFIDQKKKDALLALQSIESSTLEKSQHIHTPKTLYFKALLHFAYMKGPLYFKNAGTNLERLILYSRLDKERYDFFVKQAMLFSICFILSSQTDKQRHPYASNEHIREWQKKRTAIARSIIKGKNLLSAGEAALLEGYKLGENITPSQARLLARLYSAILEKIGARFTISSTSLKKYIEAFRRRYLLLNQEILHTWLDAKELTIERLTVLVSYHAIIDFVVYKNNTDILDISFDNEIETWYAMSVWSAHKRFSGRIPSTQYLENYKQKIINTLPSFDEKTAQHHGFSSLDELRDFAHSLFSEFSQKR